jgi:DNA helicase-2/ATP-dependent DNA helicase PcrA
VSLTEEQRVAVACDQNLLLTACPGSGKTRTIIAKLVREIEFIRDTPRSVACITYTNTAVQEIELRAAAQLISGDHAHFTVATIHSFCLANILRPFAWLLPGFNVVPKVLTRDKPEFEEIARYAAAKVNLLNPVAADFEAFENLNLDATGNLIGAALRNEPVQRAARWFWHRCEELGYVDFCNIIYKSYCLLRDHPYIARSLSARYAWFLIDEFQDTTELQTEILKLVYAAGRSKFFAVGDPAQSIYAFTGARPELVEPFGQSIGARSDLSLTGNFRSSRPIVEQAERLFRRNPPMTSVGDTMICTEEPLFARVDSTLEAITDYYLPLLADLGIAYGDATILAREWGPLFPLSRQLREFGIPVVGPGARPYRRSRLFATLAEQLCGALVDPQPDTLRQLERALFNAVQEVTTQPRYDVFTFIGRVTLVRLLREAKRLAQSGGAVAWLDAMSAAAGEILVQIELIDRTQAGLFYASVQEMKDDMRRQKVDLANLSIEDLGLFASANKALRLSTIHYAKGREYMAVAIINLREGKLPHYLATDIDAINAEKRLFYVGVTRARRLLLYVSETDNWGNPPSRFLGPDGVRVF